MDATKYTAEEQSILVTNTVYALKNVHTYIYNLYNYDLKIYILYIQYNMLLIRIYY
jgi:hypothetical protein